MPEQFGLSMREALIVAGGQAISVTEGRPDRRAGSPGCRPNFNTGPTGRGTWRGRA